MALVIVSGLPCSGRTSVCASLQSDFQARIAAASAPSASTSSSTPAAIPRRIQIVADDTVHTPRSAYALQTQEKPARASYLSAVSRALGKDVLVLADGGSGLNIKGFRYQLWCAAREQGVRCVSLHVYASPEECKRRNTERRATGADSYDDDTIDDMMKRYEEPNAMTRWDSPLFLVKSAPPIPSSSTASSGASQAQGSSASGNDPDAIPFDEIWKSATESAPRKAPSVVVPHRQTTSNYLSALETVTQATITHVLSASAASSSSIPIPPYTNLNLKLPASVADRPLTLSALQRLRRQFVKMHSTGMASGSEIASARDADTRSIRSGAGQAGGGGSGGAVTPAKKPDGAPVDVEEQIARKFVGWLEQTL
ncbi:kti12, chromatin associated [Tilletia horrida]|uniref:Kti12, chromatin associated n=1 Tax=Tilletia horrida TaxID=155126 RepID=A0AAN6GM37_9BASI|nr:kti12, chromatin associated [Tilletia horrida]KAK0551031.1 kti12, chromatin associated [Tilletia horrida]KAK0570147.1 kti12, chromatin associated [Tilletia horrida]